MPSPAQFAHVVLYRLLHLVEIQTLRCNCAVNSFRLITHVILFAMMGRTSSKVRTSLFILTIIQLCASSVSEAVTKVEILKPSSTAREGEMLTIYCRVWGLEKGNVVQHSRRLFETDGITEHLSWNDGLLDNVGERFFLAVRHLSDGSSVYFLSILHVTRKDAGNYKCQLLIPTDTGFAEVDQDVVATDIFYFPSSDPTCTSSLTRMTVSAGEEVTLNCSSEVGNPFVELTWSRTGDLSVPKSISYRDSADGKLKTELQFIASIKDTETVFLCQTKSPAFPGQNKGCHVGPISVFPSPSTEPISLASLENRTPLPSNPPLQTPTCETLCPYFDTQTLPWMVASVGATILSLVFIVVDINLCFKLRHVENIREAASKPYSYPPLMRGHAHDIYVELGPQKSRHGVESLAESSNYMALQIPRLELPTDENMNDGDHYAVQLPNLPPRFSVQNEAN
ncbi:uncharacterized protein [Amphiura filiformis]|uniref:uncharacterized protein n=1 Tax=Amphiura filiformis TaxID=82378 RepID=UPI003B223438